MKVVIGVLKNIKQMLIPFAEVIVSFEEAYSEISEDLEMTHVIGIKIENFRMVDLPVDASVTVSVEAETETSNATQGTCSKEQAWFRAV